MARTRANFAFRIRRGAVSVANRIASVLAAAAALGFICGLGWTGAATRNELQLAMQRAVRVAELRGTFTYLDEWLTMSAHMAAVTGDPRWMARYDEAGPQLTKAITEAAALATPEVRAALAETTDEASRGLIAMERAAFARTAAGDREGAALLLDGPEFAYLKAVYASGIDAFGQDLMTLAAARAKTLNDRAWIEASGLALGAVLLVAAAFATRRHAQMRAALAREEAVARTDALTDLPNRRRLYEDLHARLASMERSRGEVALLLLDLDRFKLVNDLHGHPAGDLLLQLAAARLRAAARTGDLIARLGGDEFALVAPLDPPDRSRQPIDAAAQLARRIVTAFEQPFELAGGLAIQVGASIGLTLAQSEGDSADALVRRADVALYRAKTEGRGRFCFFEPSMDAHIRARASLESELRQAIADDHIIPHFQPLVDMDTERLVGFEMLARWPHPTRGMISPAEFIPIAGDIGLIGAMTDRLLRRACHTAAAWPADIFLACNISPLQLRDRSLPTMVRAALDDAGMLPYRLELEITESALVGDLDFARDLLSELKALGVHLALDDFGTGYSSLRQLKMLPFDKIKIDAGFVGEMTSNAESRKIVAAVVGLGQSLGLITVAEGVEEPETAALLRDLGCDIGQGWLFGRPGAAEAAGALLRHCRDRTAEALTEPAGAWSGTGASGRRQTKAVPHGRSSDAVAPVPRAPSHPAPASGRLTAHERSHAAG